MIGHNTQARGWSMLTTPQKGGSPMEILIVLNGGLVEKVIFERLTGQTVAVFDRDTEGAEPEEIYTLVSENEEAPGVVTVPEIKYDADALEILQTQIDEE